MHYRWVLLADADVEAAAAVLPALDGLGLHVVMGARSQERLSALSTRGLTPGLTVPVGDRTDGEAVLTSVLDGFGALEAVIIPAERSEGNVEARARTVADAMALAEGLSQAAAALQVPVVLFGGGAEAVAAFVRLELPAEAEVRVCPRIEDLVHAVQRRTAVPTRRRDRLRSSARAFVERLWSGGDV